MRRMKMNRGNSKRYFTKNAQRVHPKNMMSTVAMGPMRGGIRL